MSEDSDWNDQTREALRDTLRRFIAGEVRLAKRGPADILGLCCEASIQEESPEAEWEQFVQFATDELNRTTNQIASERAAWPPETDCDRLDRVEGALRERGILFWQASPCCDSCTGAELPDRVVVIEQRFPGFRDSLRGYAFFIDQNMPDMLADATDLSVYLAYGWFSPDGSETPAEDYERHALAIAREVCACLRNAGFEPRWDGTLAHKIGVSLNWQRRTMLV